MTPPTSRPTTGHRTAFGQRQRHRPLDNRQIRGYGSLQVIAASGSTAAQQLGLVPAGAAQSSAGTVSGGVASLTGTDSNPGQVDGVFNTLIRLENALTTNDTTGIQSQLAALSNDQDRLNLAHSTLGEQEQSLSNIQAQLTSTATSLHSSLSQNVDVDMAQVISQLTEAQTSLEASLQTTALVSKLTLLNYLYLRFQLSRAGVTGCRSLYVSSPRVLADTSFCGLA